MARKTVQPIAIELGIKGGEKLAALNRSFRDLSKQVKLSDADITQATKDIIDFAKKAGDSEATIRGQIKAFEGLREQAAMGGKAYVQLGKDIANLKSNLQGSTSAIDAKKKAILDLANSTGATSKQIQSAIDKLSALRAETKLDSTAFAAFGKDIEGLVAKLNLLDQQSEKAAKQARLLAGGIRATPGAIRAQAQAFKEQAASVQLQIDNIDSLTNKERTLKKNVEERLALQEKLNKLLRSEAQAGFLASVESGRKAVISAANAFNDADVGINSFNKRLQLLDDTFGKLPNTTAGFNQRLQELQKQFANTIRDGGNYVSVALEIARVQREAAAATQGLGAALVNDLASGVAVRSQRNLREAIGQLQAEMLELNTTTAEGSAQYAQNAAQVNRLQKELDQITNSYRTVGDAARQANTAMGGGGINPFGAAGGRNPAYSREKEKQEMEQIAQLQQELNGLEGEYVDSVRSALQTIQDYEQKRHDDFMRQVDERQAAEDRASAQAIENIRREGQAERDQFDTLLQQQKAAASAMGIGGRTDISSLYEGIIGLSTADIRRQQQMMGKSATEVFNDIATSFRKGGQAVDLKQKSTSIGGSIAEGVVDGASDSDEINSGAKTFAQRLIAAYKAAFGIRSPSKETEQKIGIPLGLGIIRGLLSAIRSGKKEVQQEIESIAEPLIPRSRQPRRLIGTVNEDIATFTGYGTRPRPAMPGYRPLPRAAQDLDTEIGRMFNRFKNEIAGLTTDPKIYYNLVQSLPTSKITTDLAAMASRRARLYEIPSFMETQRQIGPGDLEREIASSVAGYMRELRTPNPWVGPIGDYQKFIDSVSRKTEELIRLREYLERFTLSDQKLLSGTRIAGALPPSRIGFAADESRLANILGLGATKALPPARRRFGELQRPDIAMFEPEGTAREYQKMARLLAEASSDLAAAKRFINDVGFQNLPVGVTGLSGVALTNALMGYSRQKRGLSGGGYPELRGIFPGADMGFRGGVAPGRFSFGGQEVLPPSKPQLALPSAEMREFARELEFEFRKLRAKVRGGSEGEHFMETGRGGGRYQGGFLGGGGGGGGRGGAAAAGDAGGAFSKLNQTLKEFGPLSDRSVADIRELGASLGSLQDIISPLDADFEQVNKAIAKQSRLIDRELEKREKQRSRRRGMSPMQMTQAAGAAISGGIFGGPEGFLGGAIGAIGGVGGAFAGAAIGAQIGGLRRQLGEFADYAAGIQKLQIALRGVAGSQNEFNRAMAAASSVTKELNVPQDVAIQGMTRLTAAVKGAGGGVADAELAFKNINSAIIATGGGAEQVEGAVTALVQIFSKGKVSAEEINQIAERLPGTFNKIAEASGRTGPELAKALQDGKVGLNDLMKFLVQLGDDYGALAEKIAKSSESAGARLQVAYDKMRQEVGKALQPIGAEFQAAFTEFIEDITPSLVSAARAVGDGLRFVIQNKEAIAVAASFAIKLAAVNLALKAFAALNGPVSTMFALLRTGFKATSQQAALAQTRLAAFGKTVKALAVSLAAPIVITFAVVGAEMVIAYFNRIKKARADLEATAKKPQGEVFFRSIGGTAATKQTLQRNINDITKNLDILRDRVKSTKKEIQSLEDTARTTYGGGGGGLPVKGATDRSREDLKARLQADEAEIKRLVLNYKTLVDRYIAAPDAAAGLTDFPGPVTEEKGGAGGGKAARDADRIAQQLAQIKLQEDAIERSKALLEVNTEIRENARQIVFAQTENNTQKAYALRQDGVSLEFLKRDLEIQLDYQKAVEAAALEENAQIRAAQLQLAEKQRIFGIEENINDAINDRIGLVQENTIELKKQAEALGDARFGLREQLGLVDPKEAVAKAQERFKAQYPGATEADLDLIRQQIDPTPFEKVQQNITQLKRELGELVKSANQITGAATAIGDAFSQSFVDAISGSKTAKEALADFFSSVGSYFLDMAKQIIAKMIQIAILNSVAKLLPSIGGGFNLGSTQFGAGGGEVGGIGTLGPNFGIAQRAMGGPVNANQPYIVGERGPELFVPFQRGDVVSNGELRASGASSAMMFRETGSAQLPFTRSAESISQATQTAQAMQAAGPINVKYESTVINGVEYVTREQAERIGAQSAERGRALTLQALQNSVKTRSRVGI